MSQEVKSCQRVAVQAVVHAGGVLEVHATKASAERAALTPLQITPAPNA